MTSKSLLAAACIAAVTLASGQVSAQTAAPAAAAPAAPPLAQGPNVPGVCVLSIQGAIGASTVGKYVDGRMKQIISQVNAELNTEKTTLDNDAKALDAQRATLDQGTLEQRGAALQVRANALQRKAQLREREVQATEQTALGRVGAELDPVVRQVYQQRQCSLLFQRDALVLASPAMDITQLVVTGLNAKITQFNFDRQRLDQPAAGGQTAK